MSVDDDLPWDEDAEAPSWYAVEDETRWDPDDDGRAAHLADIEVDVERSAAVVIVRFDPADSADGDPTPGPEWREDPATVDPGDLETGPSRPSHPATPAHRPAGLFGLAAGALFDATRFLVGAVSGGRPPVHPDLVRAVDTVVGVGNGVTTIAGTVVGTAGRLARPVVDLALHPPLVPQRWQPAAVLEQFENAGRASRRFGEQDALSLLSELLPAIVDAVLDRLDLTQIVLDRVDLGRVIAAVDLDAVIARVDIAGIIDRVDIDSVLGRVDLDAVIATVNLDKVIDRVDIDAVVGRLDLDALVAGVDLNKVIGTVDVNALVGTIDIDAIIDRVDVAGIAEDVIVEVNLPRIIRESSSSIATETMVGVRMGSASADQGLSRLLEKLRLRRRASPGDPDPTVLILPVVEERTPHRERRALPGRTSTDDGAGIGTATPDTAPSDSAPAVGSVATGVEDPGTDPPIPTSPPNGTGS